MGEGLAADCLDLNEKPVLRAEASFSEQSPTTYEDWEKGEEMEGADSRKGRGTPFSDGQESFGLCDQSLVARAIRHRPSHTSSQSQERQS